MPFLRARLRRADHPASSPESAVDVVVSVAPVVVASADHPAVFEAVELALRERVPESPLAEDRVDPSDRERWAPVAAVRCEPDSVRVCDQRDRPGEPVAEALRSAVPDRDFAVSDCDPAVLDFDSAVPACDAVDADRAPAAVCPDADSAHVAESVPDDPSVPDDGSSPAGDDSVVAAEQSSSQSDGSPCASTYEA